MELIIEYSSIESKKTIILNCVKISKLAGDKPAKLKKTIKFKITNTIKDFWSNNLRFNIST